MRIAILGKTRTRPEAPFDDPSWRIWGMGIALEDGTVTMADNKRRPIGRHDAWFEVHDMRDYHPATEDPTYLSYYRWLASQTKPVFTLGTMNVPAAVPLPRDEIEARFGRYFLRNTICWAMAYALLHPVTEIGLWGIDQTGTQEYEREKHGVMHFIHLARALGVTVTLPPRCALRRSPMPYPDNYQGEA
jgi:hypothetical protein